jgi:hypothetical protein
VISKIDSEENENISAENALESILIKFNLIDYLFFKGSFEETESIWKTIPFEQISKYKLINLYCFYRLREKITRQERERIKESELNDLKEKYQKLLKSKERVFDIFRYEIGFYEGLGKDFFDEFIKNTSIIPSSENYSLEAKVHFLTMGATVILEVEGNPYSASQYAQLASSLAEKMGDKPYWFAWTSSIEAKALFLISDLKNSRLKAINALDIFDTTQTGENLGKKITLDVLSQIAEFQGNFEEAIVFAQYGLLEKNKMETILRLIDLFFQKGNLDEVHKWIYEGKVELINSYKVMSTRLKIRELQLLIAEDGLKLAEQQLKLILNQKALDNFLKIYTLRLLCDTYNSVKEYKKSRKYGMEAYNLARLEKNPLEILKSLLLLINISLQQIVTSINHDDDFIVNLFNEAYLLARKSNTRLHLIELDMYDIFHQTICDKYDFRLENKLFDIKSECRDIGWIRGEELALKLISFSKLYLVEKTNIGEFLDTKENELVPTEEVIEYLNDMKNLTKKLKYKLKK